MQQHPGESQFEHVACGRDTRRRVATLAEQPRSLPAPGGTGVRGGDGVESLLSLSVVHIKDKSVARTCWR